MNIPVRAIVSTVFLAGFLHAAQPAAAASEPHRQAERPPTAGVVASDPVAAAQYAQAVVEVATFLAQVELEHTLAALDEIAHAIAVISAPPPPPLAAFPETSGRAASPPQASGNVTGACGGATNGADQFIQRESGGNPNVYNTSGSGAWGCYQLMPEHWGPRGACAGDPVTFGNYGSASPAQQAACASQLGLSAWGG